MLGILPQQIIERDDDLVEYLVPNVYKGPIMKEIAKDEAFVNYGKPTEVLIKTHSTQECTVKDCWIRGLDPDRIKRTQEWKTPLNREMNIKQGVVQVQNTEDQHVAANG